MIPEFKKLTEEERELLYQAPALVSVLASCAFNAINETRKRDAIKLSHLKTFTANPVLIPYYQEVEHGFTERFEAIARKYFPFDEEKRAELREEVNRVSEVIAKLDNKFFAITLYTSLQRYADHVKRSIHSVFQDFIFPMPIPGLSA
jgi:hypothetical protein